MARIRTIKPEFWTSEQVVECSPTARLLFVGIWNFCDDRGIHPASERRVKMEVFPGDDFTVEQIRGFIDELIQQHLLVEYEVDGSVFWLVNGFTKHQKIDKPTCRFPEPDAVTLQAVSVTNSATIRRGVGEESSTAHPRKGRESNGRESNGRESNGREGRKRAVPACPAQEITDSFNSTFGMKCQLTNKRRGQLRTRWQDEWWRDNWRTALERAGPSRFLNGDNDRGWKIDLEFFLKPDTAAKILEGKYDNRTGTNGTTRRLSAAEQREQANADAFAAVFGTGQDTAGALLIEESGTVHATPVGDVGGSAGAGQTHTK
jgi:hypothetical protein